MWYLDNIFGENNQLLLLSLKFSPSYYLEHFGIPPKIADYPDHLKYRHTFRDWIKSSTWKVVQRKKTYHNFKTKNLRIGIYKRIDFIYIQYIKSIF